MIRPGRLSARSVCSGRSHGATPLVFLAVVAFLGITVWKVSDRSGSPLYGSAGKSDEAPAVELSTVELSTAELSTAEEGRLRTALRDRHPIDGGHSLREFLEAIQPFVTQVESGLCGEASAWVPTRSAGPFVSRLRNELDGIEVTASEHTRQGRTKIRCVPIGQDSEAIREAVILWFQDQGFDDGSEITTNYVGFNAGYSPRDTFWARFSSDTVRVKPAVVRGDEGLEVWALNEALVVPGSQEIVDPDTGGTAMYISIDRVECLVPGRVRVEAHFQLKYLYGGGYEITFKKQPSGKWKAITSIVRWQS